MKKLIFLLTNLLIASPVLMADNCCQSSRQSSCSTGCSSSCSSGCDNGDCLPTHGQTYRRVDNEFQNGTPLFVSLFSTDVIRNLEEDDKHGALQVTVFGGKNTKNSDSAKYFFPYGFDEYTFDGSIVNPVTFAQNIAWRQVLAGGTAAAGVVQETVDYDNGAYAVTSTGAAALTVMEFNSDQTTYKFDANTDKSKLLPWNFGITYAALFEPLGAAAAGSQAGTGLITAPEFKSTIAPKYFYSHVGAGLALRYHFSDDKQGFFGQISTAVENVKSRICLNENVITEKTLLNAENFPVQTGVFGSVTTASNELADNPYGLTTAQLNAGVPPQTYLAGATPESTPNAFTHKSSTNVANLSPYLAQAAPKGSINAAYLNGTNGTGFPADQEGTVIKNSAAPANVSEAFMQSAWKYGHIGCQQSVTRLADIELLFGYQWLCSDCASNNWYLGIVIPTGNKPCANFVAPAVVGNGQHVALMVGSSLELMLSENECRSCWYRLDTNSRYLFKNTQMRSFDLKGNEWSRYMMVWANAEDYAAALAVVDSGAEEEIPAADRNYTPGINVFTQNMKVTPGFQIRLNQAVYFKSEKFSAELGWNVFGRAQECVKFACDWDAAPAFADASYIAGVGLNNSRTIYNDAQTMVANATANLSINNTNGRVYNLANTILNSTANTDLYSQFVITEDQVNLASAATPAAVINTPYAVLGYAFGCGDYKPVVSIGAQYEFTGNNRALNQWMVWGKFEFAF